MSATLLSLAKRMKNEADSCFSHATGSDGLPFLYANPDSHEIRTVIEMRCNIEELADFLEDCEDFFDKKPVLVLGKSDSINKWYLKTFAEAKK